uniref:NADH dehydrogenase subunit 2 n=1 Tax=Leucoma salicis TaxID=688415 RepID=UPI002008EBAC|nr:NADH dehydrogenase subunit 2 [Leucoma salicis]UOX27458.1 NADH dehydrogenase subunit 2 [Leucoma salicis]
MLLILKFFILILMMFFFILMFSTLITISSNSWLGCWIGLEINLLSFIPLISNSNNLLMNESSKKYFLIHSIASINFLFFILMILTFKILYFSMLNNFTMSMKMGSAPFLFWFPNMIEGLSWFNMFILMTWQKIAPLIIMSYYMTYNLFILMEFLNTIIGALGGNKQTSLRQLMTFSSINHPGWMMSSIMISENLWIMYMIMYSLMMSTLCLFFFYMYSFFINQMNLFNMNNIKYYFLINFFSMANLPPFLGFMIKWSSIIILSIKINYLLMIILIIMSLLSFMFYTRIILSLMLLYKINMKTNFNKIFLMNFKFMKIFIFMMSLNLWFMNIWIM